MSEMKNKRIRLIIHTGLHKTGTTALQLSFSRYFNELRENGILFPKSGYREFENSKGLATSGHDNLIHAIIKNNEDVVSKFRDEIFDLINDSKVDNPVCIISAENLTHFYNKKLIRRLVSKIESSFEFDITIITGVKSPEKLLISHIIEIYTNGVAKFYPKPIDYLKLKSIALSNYVEQLKALKSEYGVQVEYFKSVNIFENIANIRALDLTANQKKVILESSQVMPSAYVSSSLDDFTNKLDELFLITDDKINKEHLCYLAQYSNTINALDFPAYSQDSKGLEEFNKVFSSTVSERELLSSVRYKIKIGLVYLIRFFR
ncbi:hypothetical protein FCV60_09225 [Vibrio sp. F13]|uniref:hypothetical protein n=1 Tax=Vibrio sp. F13 TaxID=2070777 RepID=UPI0010BCFB37|nr:hypothetical protein [Vibrio sp. F13]TKF54485.1 hypothetical protein FCV60_09225 [Vibrio sp. F13]